LFLLAHHNDATPGFPSLLPNTPGGDALELRWGMCFRDKTFRLGINELIMRRRGTLKWDESAGEERWGVKEYEEWCVTQSGEKGLTVKAAVKRGRTQRRTETAWLDSKETKELFLTPSSSRMVRKEVKRTEGGVYDAEAYLNEEEGQEGEWEEVIEFKAEEDGLRDLEGERDALEEEKERIELEGFLGKEMDRMDDEEDEGGYKILPEEEKREER
jgi:hypothetical protein